LLAAMEHMGENDMGWLSHNVAGKFHKATELIRQVCARDDVSCDTCGLCARQRNAIVGSRRMALAGAVSMPLLGNDTQGAGREAGPFIM
jgi:hypothetical protein